jgi:stage IV sporulation protein B
VKLLNAASRKNTVRIILSIFLLISLFQVTLYYVQSPVEHKVVVGQELKLGLDFPYRLQKAMEVTVIPEEGLVLSYKGAPFHGEEFKYEGEWPVAATTGTVNVQLRIFGLIPVKKMVVNVVPQYEVVPGGQSIGVMLQSKGILVVGYSPVKTAKGDIYPGKSTGIRVGDIIIAANGKTVSEEETMAQLIDASGEKNKKVRLKVKRADGIYDFSVKPEFCSQTQRFRIGLLIRDNTAGVGTLTFYDPKSERYGALGHVVSNGNSEQKIDIKNGKIVESVVQGIEQGRKGKPGEKIGIFLHGEGLTGDIEKNTHYGIFGRLTTKPREKVTAIPVAFANQIKRGPAKIRTVVDGSSVEEFDIEILRIMPHQKTSGKGLIIKITDRQLLEKTGGIIQGMSGSPILQDGKLVGAVTHVFINEHTQGYGILAEWMLEECGLLDKKSDLTGSSVGYYPNLLSDVS